jgi:multisubunit Na+/H+ antiporter MnhB subunit
VSGIDWVMDAGLVVLVLGVGWWTVAAARSFAAVVGFVTYGLLLAIVWVRIAAVDVALTEAAIGSGVTGAVLIAAAARLGPTVSEPPGKALRIAAAALSALVALGLAGLVLFPANPAPTLASAAGAHLAALDIGNPVTAVLMAYRAIDTLLEKIVLLLALVGVWSLAPNRFWGGAPASLRMGRPGGPLALLGRLLPPVGIVFAVYMLWVGAVAPGGAFQGGAVLAAMWLLTMIAGLQAAPRIGSRKLRRVLVAGPVVFLAIGLCGFALPGGFLSYPESVVKPLIIVIEAVLMLSIAAILGMLVAGPPANEPGP